MILGRLFLILLLAAAAGGAGAREWRVAPDEGASRVAELLREAKGGDRILLAPGDWGKLNLEGRRFEAPVSVVSEIPGGARFNRLILRDVENLALEGLRVERDPGADQEGRPGALVLIVGDSSGIVLENLEISGSDTTRWTAEDWRRAPTGVRLGGHGNTVRGSRISGVRHGVHADAGRGQVIENTLIDGFSGDGIRVTGDFAVVEGNTIRGCRDVDDHHDDAIQSWSTGEDGKPGRGVVRGVVVRGNRIFEWTGPEDDPLRCDGTMHGIGLFDGVYENWTIENNLIVTGHWHGITVMGGQDMRIVNNTVVHPQAVRQDRPKIWLRPHKNGRSFDGNVVANNLASAFALPDGVVDRANLRVLHPARRFRAPGALDFRLKPDGLEAALADPALQPAADIDGRPRPAGGGDLGAFQR